MKLLIVEQDETLRRILADRLAAFDYQCDVTDITSDIIPLIEKNRYSLVLMDWDVMAANASKMILDIKRSAKKIAVMALSSSPEKEAEISALNNGADDFMGKPSAAAMSSGDLNVLQARIEARLRFGGTNVIEIDDLVIDPDEEKIFYQGKEIELKGKPFEVLTHLARHRDQIVSKEQLLDAIWEEPELVTPNVIEVAINQIRQKMDKPLSIGTIETVRRRGYRFCFPNCSEQPIVNGGK